MRRTGRRAAQKAPPGKPSPGLLRPGGPPPPPDAGVVGAYWRGAHVVVRRRSGAQAWEERHPAERACWLRAEDLAVRVSGGGSLGELLRASRFVSEVREEGEWARVRFRERDDLRAMCEPARKSTAGDPGSEGGFFAQLGLSTYEADLHPVKRWMLDARAKVGRPRRLYLDCEAHLPEGMRRFDAGRTLCWSLVDEDDVEVARGMLERDSDEDERRVLAELVVALDPYDQVLAWNGDRFDFEFLKVRTESVGLSVEWRQWLLLDHMALAQKMNVSASKSGEEKQSMALASWAAHVLGEEKLVDLADEKDVAWKMWLAGGADRRRLGDYCRDDAGKLARIEAKTGFVELHQSVCEVAGVLPDSRAIGPMQAVETFIMRLGHERGMRFPTHYRSSFEDDGEQFAGAFVLKPTRLGIVDGVHVCDFSRLYPSIAQTWNLSPETLLKRSQDVARVCGEDGLYALERPPPGVCVVPGTGHWFRTEPRGLLPFVFDEMLRLRKEWDDKKSALPPGSEAWNEADKRSTAYKNMTNAAFGVVGSRFSRFFVVECAESMTLTGAKLIKRVIAEGEAAGIETIAGDTDSAFSVGVSRPDFEAFIDRLNREVFPALVSASGASDCRIKLAYEKAFERVVFCAGKRYAGRYLHFKGVAPSEDSEPEVKGLEYKRGDCPRLARAMQSEVLDLLLGGGVLPDPARGPKKKTARRAEMVDDPAVFLKLVERWRDRVLREPLSVEDVSESKRLGKELGDFASKTKKDGTAAALPPHVVVGKELERRGRDVGAGVRVAYVVADKLAKRVIPAEDYTGEEVDRHQLWEDRVYPPTMRVLQACFPTVKWEKWRRTRKHAAPPGQGKLFEFT